MRQYKCSKCPETMDSKCPSSRSIFPSNSYVTMLSSSMLKRVKPYREGSKLTCLELEWGCGDPDATSEELFASLVAGIRSLTDEQAAILVCDHDWYLPNGTVCSLDGHAHNRRKHARVSTSTD